MAWKRTLRRDLWAGRDCATEMWGPGACDGGPASECISLGSGVGSLVFRVSQRASAAGARSSKGTRPGDENREVAESQIAEDPLALSPDQLLPCWRWGAIGECK